MRTQQTPAFNASRNTSQDKPARGDVPRSAPQVLDLRQLKQVSGGGALLPNKGW